MKLLKFKYQYDYSHDWYVQFLNTKNWSLLQFSLSWADYPSMPYLQVTMGSNGLFGLLFWAYKFGIDIDFMGRTWKWDYLPELEE